MSNPKAPKSDQLRTAAIGAIVLGLCLAAALALAGLRTARSPRPGSPAGIVHAGIRAASDYADGVAPPPPPMAFVAMPPAEAIVSNAAVPFLPGPIVPALAFRLDDVAADDREKALTCLAAAVLYEAGDDPAGERAVAQVVLNRLRHPAFPKTVCGVVLQGSERPTGCQFTFTCDGALDRPPQPNAWRRAREIAAAALAGKVEPAVGLATHYHTDWVVPYWRNSLVKLAQVHTQIFYRWKGWWGTRPAFSGILQPGEQPDGWIAALVPGDAAAAAATAGLAAEPGASAPGAAPPADPRPGLAVLGVAPKTMGGNLVRAMDQTHAVFVLELDPAAYPGSYAIVSLALCGTADRCEVMGWLPNQRPPTALPISNEIRRTATFVYLRDRAHAVEQARWDCRRIKRDDPAQCLSPTGPLPAPAT